MKRYLALFTVLAMIGMMGSVSAVSSTNTDSINMTYEGSHIYEDGDTHYTDGLTQSYAPDLGIETDLSDSHNRSVTAYNPSGDVVYENSNVQEDYAGYVFTPVDQLSYGTDYTFETVATDSTGTVLAADNTTISFAERQFDQTSYFEGNEFSYGSILDVGNQSDFSFDVALNDQLAGETGNIDLELFTSDRTTLQSASKEVTLDENGTGTVSVTFDTSGLSEGTTYSIGIAPQFGSDTYTVSPTGSGPNFETAVSGDSSGSVVINGQALQDGQAIYNYDDINAQYQAPTSFSTVEWEFKQNGVVDTSGSAGNKYIAPRPSSTGVYNLSITALDSNGQAVDQFTIQNLDVREANFDYTIDSPENLSLIENTNGTDLTIEGSISYNPQLANREVNLGFAWGDGIFSESINTGGVPITLDSNGDANFSISVPESDVQDGTYQRMRIYSGNRDVAPQIAFSTEQLASPSEIQTVSFGGQGIPSYLVGQDVEGTVSVSESVFQDYYHENGDVTYVHATHAVLDVDGDTPQVVSQGDWTDVGTVSGDEEKTESVSYSHQFSNSFKESGDYAYATILVKSENTAEPDTVDGEFNESFTWGDYSHTEIARTTEPFFVAQASTPEDPLASLGQFFDSIIGGIVDSISNIFQNGSLEMPQLENPDSLN